RQEAASEFAVEFQQWGADQATVAMNRANKHRLLRALADGAGYFTNTYLRQQGRLLVQIIGHRGETWGDDSASVIARTIDHIESHRGSKIYHHCRSTELVMHRDC